MFELVEKIGKYDIVREVGQGATSRVYLGYDPFASRNVAIKVFISDEPDCLEVTEGAAAGKPQPKSMQQRGFMAEAGLVGKLTHPHIVDIYDAGTEGNLNYIVMEYVHGGTLDVHAEPANLLPVGKVVEIVFKCVRALDMAMREGIIHRDIKPGNILLTDDGDIKISDFGAAMRMRASDSSKTVEQTMEGIIGSPGYMSPEQIRNDTLNHQTDIYSLGVVMYRLLTGRLPFNASNQLGLAYAILNADAPPPSSLRPNLPAVLDDIVMVAMAKDKQTRYANWIDFGKDLTAAFTQLRAADELSSESEQFEALRALPFFADFTDPELWEVLRISSWAEIKKDETIMVEGGPGDALYVLIDGEVEASLRGARINSIKRGGCFGEMSYFSDKIQRRTTTIKAKTDCDVIELKSSAIRGASDGVQAEFNKACMQVLIERLQNMNTRLALLKAGDND